jgi:CHRD domain-containing protein
MSGLRRPGVRVLVVTAILAAVTLLFAAATQAGQGQKLLSAKLSGAAVVPGPGNPDGSSATVELRLAPNKKEVCFKASYSITGPSSEEPNRGEVHRGREGVAGPVVVTLFTPTFFPNAPNAHCGGGFRSVKAKPSVLKDLARHPRRFYVELDSPTFPAGEWRGQLSRKPIQPVYPPPLGN